jgi:hypothetical protein
MELLVISGIVLASLASKALVLVALIYVARLAFGHWRRA